MWHLLEPLHALLYYSPEAFGEAAALGYDTAERWPAYFAWRAAPLGAAGPDRVASAFYSFSPAMVARYVPAAWETAGPAEVLAGRLRAVDRTYRALLGDLVDRPEFAEAATLARRAAEAAVTADAAVASGAVGYGAVGRPLAAANAGLPWPEAPHLALWQAATILREHRGDGHVAALAAASLDPVEALVSFAAVGAAPEPVFASRGWSAAEWTAARERLGARGLVDPEGAATEAGRALRAGVERRTDELAAAPWTALGPDDTARLADLLGGPWLAAIGSGLLPAENTLGIGKV
ncbi:SCO6745 family protein [Streptomyces exfoliatus]|uniref:SCO6745 family protein n=1 Tax=Streptomyces exfoliatus TaxID=1905 RepID=UPI003C2C9DC2